MHFLRRLKNIIVLIFNFYNIYTLAASEILTSTYLKSLRKCSPYTATMFYICALIAKEQRIVRKVRSFLCGTSFRR